MKGYYRSDSLLYLLRIGRYAPRLAELLDSRQKHAGMTKTNAAKTQLFKLNEYNFGFSGQCGDNR